jgi:O-antigen ligase
MKPFHTDPIPLAARPGRAPHSGGLASWMRRGAIVGFVLLVALLAGTQIASPQVRVIQVVIAGLVLLLAFRSSSIAALTVAVLLLPFPKATSYGNTNVAFILVIFLVWLFRVTTKRAPAPHRSPFDLPVIGLVMAYCLSFYNVEPPSHFPMAWAIFLNILTYFLVFYMTMHLIRTQADVRRILTAQSVSCLLVCLFAVYEQFHPGSALVPGWIDFQQTRSTQGQGVRIGSTFLDFELFGEFCALNLFIQMFLFTRASSRTRKYLLVGLMLLTFYCLLATVTRGAIVSLLAGLLYLAWLSRRRLNFVKLVTAVSLVVGVLYIGDFLVSNYTTSKSVLDRLFGSRLERGFIPESRAPAWAQSLEAISEHPLIGHGPYYSIEKGLGLEFWPHNVYLYYLHTVGAVGLAFFLWILWGLWRRSKPRALSLGSGSYVEGATLLSRVVLFVFLLDQLKIDYLRNARYSFFVWCLLGIIVAISGIAQREAEARAMAAERVSPLEPQAAPQPRLRRWAEHPAAGR